MTVDDQLVGNLRAGEFSEGGQQVRKVSQFHRAAAGDESRRVDEQGDVASGFGQRVQTALNQPTAADDAWTTADAWAALADPTKVVADGDEVVLFFDGSRSRDATALIGCRVEDGHVFTLGVWEPDPRHDVADQVDPAAVDATVRAARDKYDVVGFFSDVREWESFARITWPALFEGELAVHAVPGGKSPEPIAWDMRGHVKEFTLSAELTEAEITEGAFTHDGDSQLARHVANARRKHNAYGVTIRKESRDSPLKIDAAVCLIGVRHLLRLVRAAAPKKKRSGVVY